MKNLRTLNNHQKELKIFSTVMVFAIIGSLLMIASPLTTNKINHSPDTYNNAYTLSTFSKGG
jgi:hypothetical protein